MLSCKIFQDWGCVFGGQIGVLGPLCLPTKGDYQ